MKLSFIILLLCFIPQAYSQNYPYMPGLGGGGGFYGGGLGMGNANFQNNDQNAIPVFENGLNPSKVQYKSVKVNASCPLLTMTSKNDTDIFSDLKSFLSTASKKCSLSGSDPMAMMTGQQPNIMMLESMLNGDANSMSGVPGQSVKCYKKNVELIGLRNLAYFHAEKNITETMGSPFAECSALETGMDKKRDCISEKYDDMIEENKVICREMTAPQAVQTQVNKGLVGIEQILNQALSNKEECGFKSQDLFKVTMNTYLKTKALSVVGPWGAVAGFGADIVGNLLDKLFPNDAQKATALMDEILSEETFEQNACLYFNIQQKMYCEDRPIEIATPNPGCQNIQVTNDLMKLIQKYKDIKKVTDSFKSSTPERVSFGAPQMGDAPEAEIKMTPEMESELHEHLDELAKYTLANSQELKDRVKLLPKMQQSREQLKINNLIKVMESYQSYDPGKDATGQEGKKLTNEIAKFFMSKDPAMQLDISSFIVKTTQGTKLESIKQRSIARTIEQLMAAESTAPSDNESSRVMARYNKYKAGMGSIAKGKFEARLDKQFREFENQVKFVSKKDNGVVDDSVAEGQLRNLIRHCSLLQEVYDPNLEGRMPSACEKLSCNQNKLGWFMPQKDKKNYTDFKQSYCDKSLSFQKVEGDFVKELKDKGGAKICGVRVEDFF